MLEHAYFIAGILVIGLFCVVASLMIFTNPGNYLDFKIQVGCTLFVALLIFMVVSALLTENKKPKEPILEKPKCTCEQ